MIAPSSRSPSCGFTAPATNSTCGPTRNCFSPWVFMEFRDLFDDLSPDGDFRRIGCLELRADGTCQRCPQGPNVPCARPYLAPKTIHVGAAHHTLPQTEIRLALQSGNELCLEFDPSAPPQETTLTQTARLLRKLRNAGVMVRVVGLSTADKIRLSRLEWAHP